ncbi:uncharacterized protein I303_103823 [Kwoniella dejecticola CBS 10117]|uniref:Uncharacterized protein n=1 Tax=Kwoniella dejecticola CBS 10117 TaxID=1296121 RepID=A0A1A6A7U2_9TREE|nr:uncharacterized protein I303_03842 [Kwoniella dejecticola CBS 10117]OBR86122.1 hypothetical protein I303_03842 [Kwoniella dejecticola CBS 10117]
MSTTFLLQGSSASASASASVSASASSSSSSSSALPESPALSLLPFSLGPNSAPFTSTSAPLSRYFKPRSSPQPDSSSNDSSGAKKSESKAEAKAKSVVASFRGRAVAGQYIDIPNGWKGIILSTGKRPDKGGIEVHAELEKTTSKTVQPSSIDVQDEDIDDGLGLRRTTRQSAAPGGRTGTGNGRGRVKGEGQVALSKPKIRTSGIVIRQTQSRKRYRLDSDDEDEDEDEDENNDQEEKPGRQLSRTPSKRSRTGGGAYTTPQKTATSYTDTTTGEGETPISVPEIVIQEATPLKYPLPTPKKRLNERRPSPSPEPQRKRKLPEISESMELVEKVITVRHESDTQDPFLEEKTSTDGEIEGKGEDESQVSNQVKAQQGDESPNLSLTDDGRSLLEESSISIKVEGDEETLIPSPSTENDLPSFDISSAPATAVPVNQVSHASKGKADHVMEDRDWGVDQNQHDGPMRILRPTATFDGFMLYTPDDPLIGFRSDELSHIGEGQDSDQKKEEPAETAVQNGAAEDGEKASSKSDTDTPTGTNTIQVRKSWWRSGGAGEGGDEFVRGLGEYLGLMESLNTPVYLDGLEDDGDDDDEDEA